MNEELINIVDKLTCEINDHQIINIEDLEETFTYIKQQITDHNSKIKSWYDDKYYFDLRKFINQNVIIETKILLHNKYALIKF